MRRCTLKRFLHEADALIHLPQGLAGDIAGLLGALGVDLLEIGLVRQHPLGLLPHGAESLDHGLAHGGLKHAVALALKFLLNLREALAGDGGIDAHQIGHAGLLLGGVADAALRVRVGDGALELAGDLLRRIHDGLFLLRNAP